jgi:hypothetical protein
MGISGGIIMAKTAAKTVEKKPVIAKAKEKKYLEKVPEAMVFWCHDGQVFHDIDDLMVGFDMMTDETFLYHSNEDKNDFSCWIVDVIGDGELGKEIKKAKTRKQAKEVTKMRYSDLTKQEG